MPFSPDPKIPKSTLLVQADNDPFLAEDCYPRAEARQSDQLYLEITRGGGHVGFAGPWRTADWPETRAQDFLSESARF